MYWFCGCFLLFFIPSLNSGDVWGFSSVTCLLFWSAFQRTIGDFGAVVFISHTHIFISDGINPRLLLVFGSCAVLDRGSDVVEL